MIKKILPAFMAFTFLISSSIAPVFADGTHHSSIPTEYLQKGKFPRPPKSYSIASIQRIRKVSQKAFLTAILCALGIDVELKLHFSDKYFTSKNFSVCKIDNKNIYYKDKNDNTPQVKAMMDCLAGKKDIIDFDFDFGNTGIMIAGAKINGYFLNQSVIHEIGEKVLELISLIKFNAFKNNESHLPINLTANIQFKNEVTDILGDILRYDTINDKTELKLFQLPSEQKGLDSITNPVHVDFLKKHPYTFSLLVTCYQTAFFTGLLSILGISISLRPQDELSRTNFPECVLLRKINDTRVSPTGTRPNYLTRFARTINSTFPAEKLKIESLRMSYLLPSGVIINNEIVLNETDVFNLGQKFYNLIYKMISENYKNIIDTYGLIHLDKNADFVKNAKEIFKEYTGKDFPNLEH